MKPSTAPQPRSTLPLVRCAVYTRKSTEEGLEQAFNSLDAQREACEAFIASQRDEGWTCLPNRYDDGGFSGGTMDRPALRQMMTDIQAGTIDIVVVYKLDRLSRSLLDFTRMMETFEKHQVSFVSVTQQFNTATSMGRLMLHVLLSFAQFEREIIGERTRDKIAATRRKGKWTGGHPILGYDIDPNGYRLLVSDAEAAMVRAIFALYLEHEALLPVVKELERRGWTNKRWVNKAGKECGGGTFTKTNLHRLLTNVAYTGKVRHKTEVYDGEHQAIIDAADWERVQALLRRNGRSGGAPVRHQFGALLRGLIHCGSCGCAMTPAHTTKGERRYRYYTCTTAQKRGWHACPTKSIPAGEVEAFVIDQVRCIGTDPALLQQTLAQAREQDEARVAELETEQRGLARDQSRWVAELRKLALRLGPETADDPLIGRLADLQEKLAQVEKRAGGVREQIDAIRRQRLDEEQASEALRLFDPVWESLAPREQARILQLLVERIVYDGARGNIAIRFHPTAIKALTDELNRQQEQSA
jgi:site-specific DNA recombinase